MLVVVVVVVDSLGHTVADKPNMVVEVETVAAAAAESVAAAVLEAEISILP
jgi:hypothetical protein